MDELSELGIKYGTDKGTKHHYLSVYYDMFKDRKESIRYLLEIGVAEGAGLYMFRDFFPNAHIFGAEKDFERVFKEERVTVFQCDQSSMEDLERLMSRTMYFDIVIDDGSHKLHDQINTCLKLMSLLNTDVTYIIEDVSDPDSIVKALYHYDTEVIKVGDRYDDCLVIVKHKHG